MAVPFNPAYSRGLNHIDALLPARQDIMSGTGSTDFVKLREMNDRLMLAERGFLDPQGLQGKGEAGYRQWLKHMVYSPPEHNAYATTYFPGIIDALDTAQQDDTAWPQVQHEVWRAARALERVAGVLQGSLL
jgi:N-acetylated-alpha-linked acidic dipeptidase